MNISSRAGCCRTPKSTKISRKNEHQFLVRMLQRQKRQKSTSFIVKSPFKTIAEHRKVRKLPRKMNMEEVDYPKDYENLQTKPVLDPFKSTAPHRKVRELPRKMKIEEVEEPETMKIYRQNPFTPVWATRELWKFTHETNMQARNHENSDEIRPTPVRHLDVATPAFYTYRKNPKCYHTVWGIKTFMVRQVQHHPFKTNLQATKHCKNTQTKTLGSQDPTKHQYFVFGLTHLWLKNLPPAVPQFRFMQVPPARTAIRWMLPASRIDVDAWSSQAHQ